MSKKITPYIFLGALVVVLVFLAGLRYGQKVEKTNKTIDYLISIAPTKSAPSQIPLEFKIYELKACGLSFLYPSTYSEKNHSSQSAYLAIDKNQPAIEIDCTQPDNSLKNFIGEKKTPTQEIKLLNQTVKATKVVGPPDSLVFQLKNYRLGKTLTFSIPATLLPLFKKSLELK